MTRSGTATSAYCGASRSGAASVRSRAAVGAAFTWAIGGCTGIKVSLKQPKGEASKGWLSIPKGHSIRIVKKRRAYSLYAFTHGAPHVSAYSFGLYTSP